MKLIIKKLCSKKHFDLDHRDPSLFTQGRWTSEAKVTISYLLFKFMISLYIIAAYIVSHIRYAITYDSCEIKGNGNNQDVPNNKNSEIEKDLETSISNCCIGSDWPYYWIYFTCWSWTLICISFWLDSTLVFLRYMKERKQRKLVNGSKITSIEKDFHIGIRISWLFSTISYSSALVSTIIHHAFLAASYDNELLVYNDLNVHAFQSVIAFVDTIISSRPWKIGHFYFVIVYGLVYFIFQIVYIMGFDGTDKYCHDYIYPIVNWKSDFGNALTIYMAINVLIVFCHFLFCFLTLARDKLWLYTHKKSINRSEIDIENEHRTYIPKIVVEDKKQEAQCPSNETENDTKSTLQVSDNNITRTSKKIMRKNYHYKDGHIVKNGQKFRYKF